MTRVICYGADPSVLANGDVTGHELIRIPYVSGATDPQAWLQDAAAAWKAGYSLDADELRALVFRLPGAPTAALRAIRDRMAERLTAVGTRLVLAVPSADLAATQAILDANPSRIRTYATTPAQLQAWVDAHTWPVPLNPALGGTGRRVGGGRHAPWSLCITDPTPNPLEAP